MTNVFLSKESSGGKSSDDELQDKTIKIAFSVIICGGRKRKNVVWTCEVMFKGSHGERFAQLVCELLIISSRLMNIAAFSTRDLREQGCKSYEASYRANKELVVLNYVNEGDFPRTIPNIW